LLSSVSGKDEKKELYFNQHQARCMSSMTDFLPDLPEAVKQYSIWGGSGIILKAFHAQGVPYWGCMSLTNVMVRTSLLPLVIKGAKTSAKFSNVAPEVQFLISSYIRDANKLKDGNAPPSQRLELLVAAWKTLKGIWRLNGVNPFDVMKVRKSNDEILVLFVIL
jgi:membrane protein insertase Oxa1/YidC/SpoIIIJ